MFIRCGREGKLIKILFNNIYPYFKCTDPLMKQFHCQERLHLYSHKWKQWMCKENHGFLSNNKRLEISKLFSDRELVK